ncbi:MAG: Asp-tRNA(Asn)/Glu-tRNA(Gln) amidotransferase subunit GatC [Patescibacteria group bacterium]
MAITKEEIEHIAELSRLELTAEEKEKFAGQLDSVLEYISQLNGVDTRNVEPTAQVSGLVDVWREDKALPWDRDEVNDALRQGELEDGQIKVKRVL